MGRSFPSAIAQHQTPDYARPIPLAPVTAEYSTAISTVYTVDQGNREVDHPAIGFERRGDGPDPRMVELARLLARRAGREVYEEQMRERRPTRF